MRLLVVLLCALVTASAHAGFEVVRAEQAVPGTHITETVWALDVAPFGSYDRIQLHRYRAAGESRGALLHLPGTNMSGAIAPVDEDHNFWVFLALRGIEVFVLDYRTHQVPPSGITDFAFMREWTVDRFVDDARLAAEFTVQTSGHKQIFLSGFSRGVSFAYGLVSVAPVESLAGLVALDGGFKNYRESPFSDYEGAVAKMVESKRFVSDVAGGRGWEGRHQLMRRACENPDGPPVNDRYSTIGVEVTETLYNAWGPGRLANAKGGISRPQPLACLLDTYDRYWPMVQNLDGRAIASQKNDPRTVVDDRWGEFKLPILHFSSTGMGADAILSGIYSASQSGSRSVELHVLERYGHLDVLAGERARQEVYEPILGWINDLLK